METCKNCKFNEVSYPPCESCFDYDQYRKKTNADRIRAMSDEQLAELLYETEMQYASPDLNNDNTWFDWLKQEVE